MSCDSDTDCENAVDGKTKCLSRGFCKYENYCLSNEDCEDNPEGKTKCYDYACVEP
jgi:hypothetical protein